MSKYVRETKAGKSISAYVILKQGKEIASVLVHYSDGGRCLVNCFQRDAAAKRCAAARNKINKVDKAKNPGRGNDPRDFYFQHATAGGYGYDKFTAALAGLWIDGHELTDHCGRSVKPPKGRKTWPHGAKPPRGYSFANYHSEFLTFGFETKKHKNPNYIGEEGYTSCYRLQGLKYLEAIGYTVIQAI